MNILIIDDEPLILNTVYQQLRQTELQLDRVDTAGSATEARKKMDTCYYHIFLCDIVMPEEDGITFARWTLGKYPDSKFIFLTAHADFEYMKEAISMQSFDYILQPAGKEELENVVHRAIWQISIEKKNRELMDTGSFFTGRELDILEGNAIRYLLGRSRDDSFLRRLIDMKIGDWGRGVSYLPFLVQILKSGTSWEESDSALLRSIYYNIIDELMEPFRTRNVLILRHDSTGNFMALLMFGPGSVQDGDAVFRQLDNMRVFFQKLMRMETVVYCGGFCEYGDLYDM